MGWAIGTSTKCQVLLPRLERLDSLEDFDQWLRQERDWLGAFDFPFGLPRELVTYLGWPTQWIELINHHASLSRLEIRNTFAAFSMPVLSDKNFSIAVLTGHPAPVHQ